MVSHLATCSSTHDTLGPSQPNAILRFDAAGDTRYWLLIEASANAKLKHIDALLRKVWLECCGHMSAFRVAQRELAMSATVTVAFGRAGAQLEYEYDFGSTTELVGELVGQRRGASTRAPVRLLARNEPLAWRCADCKALATIACPYCLDAGDGLFCDTHADAHEHAGEEVYLPVVNSPRMGVCGYTG